MAKYLAMEYDDCIYSRFSSAAVAIAESMGWDVALKKPISANESTCHDIETITFSWEVATLASVNSLISHPMVNFGNLTVSSLDNPPPLHSPSSPLPSLQLPLLLLQLMTPWPAPPAQPAYSVRCFRHKSRP